MAQYDVFAIAGSSDLFLELQANRVQGLSTKIGCAAGRERPVRSTYSGIAAGARGGHHAHAAYPLIPTSDLKDRRAHIAASEYRITSALDLLFLHLKTSTLLRAPTLLRNQISGVASRYSSNLLNEVS